MGFFTQDLVRRTASKHPDAPRASVSGPHAHGHGPWQARWDSPAQHLVVFAILVALVVVLRNL